MRTARVQLWGGHLDGLRANVEITMLGEPPCCVVVPALPQGALPPLLLEGHAEVAYEGVKTVRYELDPEHMGTELLYRIERMAGT